MLSPSRDATSGDISGDAILFEQREIQSLCVDPMKLKDFIYTGKDLIATLIHIWSLNDKKCIKKF
jgi:hypothetical protein